MWVSPTVDPVEFISRGDRRSTIPLVTPSQRGRIFLLKQASVQQLRQQVVTRTQGYVSVCMAFYPRGVKRELMDDYRPDLAPDRELFKEWKEFERQVGHDKAFELSRYESRFQLSAIGLYHLKKYSELSQTQDVFLVCQCTIGERCHREMLILCAQQRYGAVAEPIRHAYPEWARRVPDLDDVLKW